MMLPVVFPMGAVGFDEKKHDNHWNDPNWVAERKYDGFRYLIKKEGGKISVLSRNPSVESVKAGNPLPVDKTENVPHLVELFKHIPDGSIIDGEIITHENCESHEVTRIMGCDPDKAIARQEEEGWVKFVIFDVLFLNGHDITQKPYSFRRRAVEIVHREHASGSKYVLLAPVFPINKMAHYEHIVEGGGEGVILKNIHAKYEVTTDPKKTKKPKDTWVKVKKYKTFDVVIMGFTNPTREYTGKELETWSFWQKPDGDLYYRQNDNVQTLLNFGFTPVTKPYYYGWCGAVVFGQYRDGELVEVGQTSGISDDVKQKLADNPHDYVGKVMEVGAMRQNKKSGALVHPRFKQFRDDKLPEQCIVGVE